MASALMGVFVLLVAVTGLCICVVTLLGPEDES